MRSALVNYKILDGSGQEVFQGSETFHFDRTFTGAYFNAKLEEIFDKYQKNNHPFEGKLTGKARIIATYIYLFEPK